MTTPARRRAAQKPALQSRADLGENGFLVTPNVPKSKKTLYILFGGQDGMFFIPSAALLALLPEGLKDVAVIRSGIQLYYLAGIEGLGRDTNEVAANLRNKLKTDEYDRVVTIGISVGGLFALRIADGLGADVGLSFAAVYTDGGFWVKDLVNAGSTAFDPLCECMPMRAGRMINVLGSKNELDVRTSRRIQNVRRSMLEYHLINSMQHNVLLNLMSSGFAKVFFRLALSRNGAAIRLFATLSKIYGFYLVRNIRRLVGRQ